MMRWSLSDSPPLWYMGFWFVMLFGWFVATRQANISAEKWKRRHPIGDERDG